MKPLSLFTVILALVLLAWTGAAAQDSSTIEEFDSSDHRDFIPPLFLIEPGPVVESSLFDGSVVQLETQTVSRLICGSDATGLTVDDLRNIVISGREAFAADPNVITISRAAEPRDGGPRTTLDIVFNVSNPPAGATTALETAAAYIESLFTDPVTVTINVSFANLGGDVLGSTSNNYAGSPGWSTVRDALIAGKDPNDTIQDWLPTTATLPVRYDGTSATVTNEDRVWVSVANYNAAIGAAAGTAASMQFNNTFPWDYDPSNGVGGSYCFQSVIVHEVGHVLGFVSGADFRSYDCETMDIYRFQRTDGAGDYNPDTLAELQTTARLVDLNVPDDDHNSDLISIEYRMSDGVPYQASHFRQGSVNAIMQPAIGAGTTFYPNFFRTPDTDMFDAIGWDYSPEPGTTTLPFFDDFPTTTIDTALWTGIENAQSNDVGLTEPSAAYSLNLDGSAGGGDKIRTAIMDTSALDDVVIEYYWQRTGGGDSPETGDDLVVEYFNASSAWVEITRYLGSDSDMTAYTFASHTLTAADALHSFFRVQFRAVSATAGTDDWFVDDVAITTNTDFTPPTPDPAEWELLPEPVSTTLITMTQAPATDPAGVEYRFYSGTGAALSSWQESRTYLRSGLTANSIYSYKCKSRDLSSQLNETALSTPAWWTATAIESPTGISFANVTDTTMDVTALGSFTNLSANESGLFFEMTPDVPGSGANVWTVATTSTTVSLTGLNPGTTYTFRVKARNFYGSRGGPYETAWVGPAIQQTTGGPTCSLLGDVNGDAAVDGRDIGGFVRAKLGQPPEPGENQACADYGGPTLQDDINTFIADLL